MADSIFRIATREAIKEIIMDNAESMRFGVLLTEESLEMACNRVVDLFETTLELRAKVKNDYPGFEPFANTPAQNNSAKSQSFKGDKADFMDGPIKFPKTRNASEIYDKSANKPFKSASDSIPHAPAINLALPRKRHSFSEAEKERFMK